MREETRKTLETVVSKAAKLQRSTFFQELEQGNWKISFPGRNVVVSKPPEEVQKAFILDFRFFIMGNESTSFRSLSKLRSDPELSEQWKGSVAAATDAVNQHLDTTRERSSNGREVRRMDAEPVLDRNVGDVVHHYDQGVLCCNLLSRRRICDGTAAPSWDV